MMLQSPLDSDLPSGKRLHNYGTSTFFMGQLTISMATFNSKLLVITLTVPEGINQLRSLQLLIWIRLAANSLRSETSPQPLGFPKNGQLNPTAKLQQITTAKVCQVSKSHRMDPPPLKLAN